MFGRFKIHAGDFKKCSDHRFIGGYPCAMQLVNEGQFMPEKVYIHEIESLEVANEESVKRLGGTVGWGIAGGVLLGPVGLLAGLLAGGRGKDVTFVCKLKDGRKFMATAPAAVYTKIMAARF